MKTLTPRISKKSGLAAAYRSIAQWQGRGCSCVVVSVGHDVDISAVSKSGGIAENLLVFMPYTTEQASEIVSALRRSRRVDRCYVLGADCKIAAA